MKASRDRIAANEASSSPASVKDSRNGDAPAVAISSPAANATVRRPVRRKARSIVASTLSAPTTAATARIASVDVPSWSTPRKTRISPCGRSTQMSR